MICFLLTLDDGSETEKTVNLLHGENSILSRLDAKEGEYVNGDRKLKFLSELFTGESHRVAKAKVLKISHYHTH